MKHNLMALLDFPSLATKALIRYLQTSENNSIMHKNLYLILCCLLTFAGTCVSAQSSDGFSYDPAPTLEGLGTAENGWGTGWLVASDTDSSALVAGGILNETLLARTAGNRVVLTSTVGQNRYQRMFANPITDADGEFWFSAHMAMNGNPAGNVGTLSFIDTLQNSERLTVGKRFGNRNVFATGAGAGATNSGRQFQGADGRWLVGHMVFDAAAGDWKLDMWVDVAPGTEPAEADAQIMNKAYPNAVFNGVRIKSEGAPGILFSVDDIYVGSTYASIVPADLIIVDALPAGATEKMDYALGDSLAGQFGGSGWDTDWNLVAGIQPAIVEDGIESTSLMRRTSGNRAEANGNVRIVRSLDGSYGDVGRTFWVSYFFQTQDAGANVSHFVLADENTLAATGGDGRLAQIGSGFNNANIAVVGGGPQSGTGISSAEGHLVVLEIATNGSAANDEIYVYIDPALDAQPSRAEANAVGLRNLTNWNAIALLQDGGGTVKANWDDILVGNSFAEVIADDLIDTSIPQTAIAFDQFNYGSDDAVLASGSASDGWSGPWDTINTANVRATIATGGVVNDNLLVRTSSNTYEGVSIGENNRVIRYFEAPLTAEDNSVIWFSAHMAVSGNVAGNVGTIVLSDTTQGNNERIIIGKRFGNRNLFATGTGAGATNSGKFFSGTSARWVVGKLMASDTSDNWILDLWVDPDPGMEPDSANADIVDKIYPAADFNSISIKTEGAAGLIYEVDDIFLGSVFTDVVPADLTPIAGAGAGAVETFDYPAGEMLGGQDGGSGWNSPWLITADDDPSITEEGIINFDILKQTSGNKVTFASNGKAVRKLAGNYGDSGRSYWVGYWFDSENGGPNVTNLVLADSTRFAEGGPGELLQIGRSFNGSVLRLIGQGQTNVSASEGHFVVLELVTNGTATADAVYMWVDPDLGITPSRDTADVVGSANLTNWNAIGLKVAGDPGVTVEWDDIYVGRSYGSIVPGDLSDVQSPDEPIVAYEPFDYTAGEDLAEQDGGSGWVAPWTKVGGVASIDAGSIASDRLEGIGNKAGIVQMGDAVTYTREFFSRFAEDSPEKSTIWMSYLMDVTDNSIGNLGTVGLMDGDTSIIAIGATQGIGNFAATYNGAAQEVSDVSAGGANWVVVRLDLYGSGVTDSAYVWINPQADVLPDPAAADITLLDFEAGNGFDKIRVNASGAQSLSMFVDEVYTGFSFRDVSPGFGSDDPNLLAYEPFNYDAGSALFGQGGVNAFWDGVWEEASPLGAVNELAITEGSIDGVDLDEIGNKAEFAFLEPLVNIRADRKLAFPLLSDGRTYWLTFLMNTTQGESMDNVSNVTFRSSGIAANGGQRLSVGRQFGDGLLGFVTPPSGNSRRSEIMDEGLHWLVFRVQTSAGAEPDSVAMWIDPPVDVEPDTSTAFNYGLTTVFEGAPIDIMRIRIDGSGANQTPYITNFDELRIATAWPSARLTTDVISPEEDDVFQLTAFPNPFGHELNVRFDAEVSGRYTLDLLDMNGRQVASLFNGDVSVGEQQVRWNNSHLANGFYFLRVRQGNRSTVRKLVLYR